MTQINTDLIPIIRQSMEIDLPANISFDQLKEKLSLHINFLIQSDFQKLVSILYRVDVNESKLKDLLKENPGQDASTIIADLVIERQLQKIKARKEHRKDENINDDEKW
ncbi:MAG TPA: hypothetical protein VF144_21940 [Chitinophagaceae bacterium]